MIFKRRCQKCYIEKTKEKDEKGEYICAECKELVKKADSSPRIKCPKDDIKMMIKIFYRDNFIYHECSVCGIVVLDTGEFEWILELLKN